MNRKLAIIASILLVVLIVIFSFADIGQSRVTMSHESGFYDDSFYLEMSAPAGCRIYYTTDGSVPGKDSIPYTGPILVSDASGNPNVYSMRTDVTGGFSDRLNLKNHSDDEDPTQMDSNYAYSYEVPDYNVDKCTVIRAVYVNIFGEMSKINTASFFVGFDDKAGYDGIGVISLVSDPDNLFGYENGIYVLGKTFDDALEENEEEVYDSSWNWWSANYREEGSLWERDADITFFDAVHNKQLDKSIGVRIHGGGSRGYIPKSLNLYARSRYDGSDRFEYDFFGDGIEPDAVSLFMGGDDYESKFKDKFVAELVNDRDFATMHYIPYVLFLDGEYWGVYMLTEKYSDVYLSDHYEVAAENVAMFKEPEVMSCGSDADMENYEELLEHLRYADMVSEYDFEKACSYMDVESMMDYYATEIYVARCDDWPVYNEALWKTRFGGNKKYEDNLWRWMMFDINSCAIKEGLVDHDTVAFAAEVSRTFGHMCRNEEFRKRFAITYMDIINYYFDEEKVDRIIDDFRDQMMEPMYANNRRFYGKEKADFIFPKAMDDFKIFFDNRKPYAVKYLADYFEIPNETYTISVSVNDGTAGHVVLNTLELSGDECAKGFSGDYYSAYPVTLTAAPEEGYVFRGWEGLENVELADGTDAFSADLKLILDDDVVLRAVFSKVEDAD